MLSVGRTRSYVSNVAANELLRGRLIGTWCDCSRTASPTHLARNAGTRLGNIATHEHAVARALDRPFAFGTVVLVGFGVERDECAPGLGLNVN